MNYVPCVTVPLTAVYAVLVRICQVEEELCSLCDSPFNSCVCCPSGNLPGLGGIMFPAGLEELEDRLCGIVIYCYRSAARML